MTILQDAIYFHNQGNFNKAEQLYLSFLNSNPDDAEANNYLGLLYSQTQQFDKAEQYIKKAIDLNETINYLENLGVCYYLQEKYDKAMPYFEKIIENHPKDLDRIRDYAKLAKDSKQWEFAIKFYSKSVEIDKRDHVGLNNIGMAYDKLLQFKKAKDFYDRALKIKPSYSVYHNLGVYYRRARNFEKSVTCLKRALTFQPDNVETMTSLGMSYLSLKDFENGYKYYTKRSPHIRKIFFNEWTDKQEHKNSTLLVYPDGGRGDQLMFCRYIPYSEKYFNKIVFLVYEELKSFFVYNYPQYQVCSFNDKYPYDYCVNLMEIHYKLGIDFDNIPFSEGYLQADEEKIKQYKEQFFNTDKLKIGLYWQGNLNVFPYRSMKLKELEPLLNLNNCQFYSCQKGDGIEQLKDFDNIIDLGSTFKDYTDTAAALKNLDILITIDSSIVHLSGGLGVKTFLLLPHASEWRWFSEIQKTDWYNSVKLFKQETLFDWSVPVNNILLALQNYKI